MFGVGTLLAYKKKELFINPEAVVV